MTVDASPKGRIRRALLRSSLTPRLDWRIARTSLYACCCATTLSTAALPGKAHAQQPASPQPASPDVRWCRS